MIQNLISLGGLGKLRNRLTPLTGIPVLLPSSVSGICTLVQEVSVIVEPTGYKVYFTVQNNGVTADNTIGMATCDSLAGTWTVSPTPVIGMGYGGAPAGRRANSSFAFKSGGYYYCTATDGFGNTTSNVFLYRSADGITWSDLGLLIDKASIGSFELGNTSVYPVLVNGVYNMLVDGVRNGYWQVFRFTSTNIESGWVLANTLPGLQVSAGGLFGGSHHFYLNNKWYIFYHYAPNGGDFPSYLTWATSDDLVTVQKKETPLFALETMPFPNTDQNADPFIVQGNDGRCYLLAEYEQNSPTGKAQIWMWTFNGTMQQLLANT